MRFTTRTVSSDSVATVSTVNSTNSQTPLSPTPEQSQQSTPLLQRLRQYLLSILLIFTFTTLILGIIYAYCVAQPHRQPVNLLNTDPNAERDDSIWSWRRDANATASTTSLSNHETPGSLTGLVFYTLTLPILSFLHICLELFTIFWTPRFLSRLSSSNTLPQILVIILTTLLGLGWCATTTLWMTCELPSLAISNSSSPVCPVQTHDHFMYGIHEISIAKSVIAWVIVALYISHLAVAILSLVDNRRKRVLARHGLAKEIAAGSSGPLSATDVEKEFVRDARKVKAQEWKADVERWARTVVV